MSFDYLPILKQHWKNQEKVSPFEIYPRLTVTIVLVEAIALFLLINHYWK